MTGFIPAARSPSTISSPTVNLFDSLSRDLSELLQAPPWLQENDHNKTNWNQWAETVRQKVQEGTDPSVAELANLDFAEISGEEEWNNFADFSGMRFPGDVSFERIKFRGGTSFDNAVFFGKVSFVQGVPRPENGESYLSAAKFSIRCSFVGTVFSEAAIFDGVGFNSSPNFEGATFCADASFERANFRRSSYFVDCSFLGDAIFEGAEFSFQGFGQSEISFARSRFAKDARFARCLFRGSSASLVPVDFTEVRFANGVDFRHARFGDVSDEGVTREVEVKLDNLSSEEQLDFKGAEFRSDFRLPTDSRYDVSLRFDDVSFFKSASFSNCYFLRPKGVALSALKAKFFGDLDFDGVNLEGDCSFEGATFSQSSNFSNTRFLGRFDAVSVFNLSRCVFLGLADFHAVELGSSDNPCHIYFEHAKFAETAHFNFYGLDCCGDANFSSASFEPVVKIERVKFSGLLNFSDAEFKRRFSISNILSSSGKMNFDHVIFHDIFEIGLDASNVVRDVKGPATFQHAHFKESFSLRNIHFHESVSFINARFDRVASIERCVFGQADAEQRNAKLDFGEVRFSDRLVLSDLVVHSEMRFSKSPGVLALEVENVKITTFLPTFNRMQIEDPAEINRISFVPSVEEVIAISTKGGDQASKRNASKRLRQLADYADASNEKSDRDHLLDCAHYLAPDPLKGSKLLHYSTTLILGRRRESATRAISILAAFAIIFFPLCYIASSKKVVGEPLNSWSVEDFGSRCVDGSQGWRVAAALYVSLRSTLFPIPDTEDRSRQASQCLYGSKSQVLATHWFSLLPILQGALSAILLFAIGFAVRRRLTR